MSKTHSIISGAMTAGSLGLFAKGYQYEKKAREKINNLDRLEMISMIYLHDQGKRNIKQEESNMKRVKLFSKVSNKTLLIGGTGLGLMAAAAVKGIFFDDSTSVCDGCPALEEVTENITEAAEELVPEEE